MKKYVASAAIALLTIGSAFAADLPSRKADPVAAPPPPPPPMWTGFYAGLNIGGNVGTNSAISSNPLQTASMVYNDVGQPNPNPPGYDQYFANFTGGSANRAGGGMTQSGVIGGLQFGYNQQIGSRFVAGLEVDFQGTSTAGASSLSGSSIAGTTPIIEPPPRPPEIFTLNGSTSQSVNANLNWLGTVRGRFGFLLTPTLLTYATGGFTYGGVNVNNRFVAIQNSALLNETDVANVSAFGTQVALGGGSKSQVLVGWNVGGGVEWKFLENWSLKAEAIYWNLGNFTAPSQATAGSTTINMCPGECNEDVRITSGFFSGPVKVNYQGVIARAGVNYHFNWGRLNPDFVGF